MNYDPDPDAIPSVTDDLAFPESLPNVLSFPLDPEDGSALTRRARLRAAGLAAGRISFWTRMGAAQLWREWRRRFADDDDLAFSTLLDVADELGRDQSPKQQEELRQLKLALLGDAFSEGEHLEAIGPDERAAAAAVRRRDPSAQVRRGAAGGVSVVGVRLVIAV